MIGLLLRLKLRKHYKRIFEKKLRKTLRIRFTRTRQVRKFSSNFLLNKRKLKLLSLFFTNKNKRRIKMRKKTYKPIEVSFEKTRFVAKHLISRYKNYKVALKNTESIHKYKKLNRRKRTNRKLKTFKYFHRFPNELFHVNPLTRFYKCNLKVLSINYSYLLNFHTAIGNSYKSWINPGVFSKILAIRNNMILFDLSFTFIALKKGLQTIFQISKFRGSVLGYVNFERHYKFSGVGFEHFLRSWLPGYLTNFKKVIKNILSLQTNNMLNMTRRQKKFIKNIDLKKKVNLKKNFYFMKKLKKEKRESSKKVPSIPSFGFSLDDSSIWINECQKVGLRTMAVCDSESFPQKIDFPLVGNQKSLPLSFFLVKIVAETITSGKRFDYFSFAGFKYISDHIISTKKVGDRLSKKMSFKLY